MSEQPQTLSATVAAQGEPPAWRSRRAVAVFVLVVLATLAGDLWLKAWSFANVAPQPVLLARDGAENYYAIPPHEPIVVIPRVLSLRLTTNIGAVFGIGQGQQWFFVIVSLLVVPVISLIFARSSARAWAYHLALALILGGALGNLYDRIRFNAVRDMLYLFPEVRLPFGLRWLGGAEEVYPWIFNIADVSLVIGVGILMVILWRGDKRPQTAPTSRG